MQESANINRTYIYISAQLCLRTQRHTSRIGAGMHWNNPKDHCSLLTAVNSWIKTQTSLPGIPKTLRQTPWPINEKHDANLTGYFQDNYWLSWSLFHDYFLMHECHFRLQITYVQISQRKSYAPLVPNRAIWLAWHHNNNVWHNKKQTVEHKVKQSSRIQLIIYLIVAWQTRIQTSWDIYEPYSGYFFTTFGSFFSL